MRQAKLDAIRNAFKRLGAKNVKVHFEPESVEGEVKLPSYIVVEMDELHAEDRQFIASKVAGLYNLRLDGGGTLLARKGQKARSDVTFIIKREGKSK